MLMITGITDQTGNYVFEVSSLLWLGLFRTSGEGIRGGTWQEAAGWVD
ncbi:MAG TPA: hypothetical protein VMV31_13950 [Terriglobales bacterium]|nr:hypothetical protein [Terriglobales bacterium]